MDHMPFYALRFPSQVSYDILPNLHPPNHMKIVISNVRSFIEQSMHAPLQQATRFQIPIPLVVAVVVFSSLQIVGRARPTSAVALSSTLSKTLKRLSTWERVPLLPSLFSIFNRAINSVYLQVRIYVETPIYWRHLFNRTHGKPCPEDTYATPRAEAKYWRVAGRYRRRLYSGNATFTPSDPSTASRDAAVIPLVTYYTPRLLPLYRQHSIEKRASQEADMTLDGRISPKTFCKWHRMVFQDMCHPTLSQAAVQMKYYSSRDLREIQRIARLLPDEQVFDPKWPCARETKWTAKYQEMWASWLEAKGVDLVIVFE